MSFIVESLGSDGVFSLYAVSDAQTNQCGPFQRSEDGALYVLLVEKIESEAHVMKSTDGGLTWDLLPAVGPILHQAFLTGVPGHDLRRQTLSGQQVGDTIWIAYRDSIGLLSVTSFNLASETWGGTNLIGGRTYSVDSDDNDVEGSGEPLITSLRGDELLIYYNGIRDDDIVTGGYFRSYVTIWNTSTLTLVGDVTLGENVEHNFDARAMIGGSDDRTHLFYTDHTEGSFATFQVTLDSSNTLHPRQSIGTAIDIYQPHAYSSSGQLLVPVARQSGSISSAHALSATSANEPVWSSSEITVVQPGQEINFVQPRIVVDKGTCQFAVIHSSVTAETARLQYVTKSAGGGWGARSTLVNPFSENFESNVGHYSIRKIGTKLHGVVSNFHPNRPFAPMIYYFQFDVLPCGAKNYSYFGSTMGSFGIPEGGGYSLLT